MERGVVICGVGVFFWVIVSLELRVLGMQNKQRPQDIMYDTNRHTSGSPLEIMSRKRLVIS